MSVWGKLMSWFTGIHTDPNSALPTPSLSADAGGEPSAYIDPRILELDRINRDNDARLERLGLSRAVLEERIFADHARLLSQQEDGA